MGERGVSNNSAAGKPDRTKLAFAGGLAVILAAFVMRTFSSGPEGAAAALTNEPDPASVVASSNSNRPVVHVPRVIDWPSRVARDPFVSSVVYRPAPPPPKPDEPAPPPPPPPPPAIDLAKEAADTIPLTATVVGEKPIAMINGRIYRVGEIVGGFRIVEIHARRIIVERDRQRIPIEVPQ
jgi:hypothetical protein